MKKVVLGLALSLAFSYAASAAEQTTSTEAELNCSNFAEILTQAAAADLLNSVSVLTANCADFSDQIIEQAIALAPVEQHQEIMQTAVDTGNISPADALLAALAGGGDIATLSEATAAGNLAIAPASATTPGAIGGRTNGGGIPASGN